ncbi:hypothetical protein [Syntrophomonas palmitatica]|nr:hypothetical protein [Syntrophomonas palmitatica]
MGKNLFFIILCAAILALLIPITSSYYHSEEAFTPDNLIKVNVVTQ